MSAPNAVAGQSGGSIEGPCFFHSRSLIVFAHSRQKLAGRFSWNCFASQACRALCLFSARLCVFRTADFPPASVKQSRPYRSWNLTKRVEYLICDLPGAFGLDDHIARIAMGLQELADDIQ